MSILSSLNTRAATSFPFDDDLTWSESVWYNGVYVYALTKLANILFTRELADRLQGSSVQAFAVNPGAVSTELGRSVGGE